MERKANLRLSDTGDLEGKLTVTYTGLEAMYHRLRCAHADDSRAKEIPGRSGKGLQFPAASEVRTGQPA